MQTLFPIPHKFLTNTYKGTVSKPKQYRYYLQQQPTPHLFFSITGKALLQFERLIFWGERTTIIIFRFYAFGTKETRQIPTLEFLKPLILDQCGLLGEVSWP